MSALPQPIDRTIATRFEGESKSFSEKAAQLSKLAPTLTNANLALEFDSEAKRWLDAAETERVKMKKPLLDATRAQDDFWKRMMSPAQAVRNMARRISADYERQRQAKIAEQRRIDEAAQRAEAERQRKAEADHLLAVAAATNDPAALEVAIEVENTPIAPVVSTVDTNAGKVEGSSVTLKKTGRIVDLRATLIFLAHWPSTPDLVNVKSNEDREGPALWINQSALDDKLNRGIEIPGVEVMERAITRNNSRG